MKTFFATAAAGATALALLSASPALAETLRIAGNFPVEHSSSVAMERFADAVAKKTGGEVEIANFPAMQLGGAKENVDQVRSGVVFGTWIGSAYLSRTVPELEAVSLPFAYPDRETAFRVIDGPAGDLLEEKLAERGFVPLGWMELGSRNVTNNERAIETVEDFEGLKIRLQPNETHLATFRAIGASPVSMGISEVYSALQQGVLDGQENPYSIIASRNFDEVQSHLSDSGHFFDYIVLVANKRKFDALSEEHKAAIREAADEAIEWQRGKAAEEDEASKQALIDAGMTFTPISDETRAALRERSQPVIGELKDRIGADLIDMVLKEASAQ
ncbi:TRAP transporter substrate-binding protein [Marivita sp. GX14005]|uniref:TRAP transporter substrate-binding protein n=1 Tax=Marivita sp. GX14005 TaxID=2942276 RepID=UPI002019274D|nr:TRAP transporter substrate-binding protein [Marivita sp. GX14005]MCL3883117.1 TRAP transporter substrate-binding protein [Marivita sp. GX14005]